jgi:hypothetical protein
MQARTQGYEARAALGRSSFSDTSKKDPTATIMALWVRAGCVPRFHWSRDAALVCPLRRTHASSNGDWRMKAPVSRQCPWKTSKPTWKEESWFCWCFEAGYDGYAPGRQKLGTVASALR